MSRRVRTVALMLTLAIVASVHGQEAELQRGFSSLTLGMSLDEAKSVLADDPYFAYRGDPDVSFLPERDLPVIAVDGRTFVARGLLQFTDDALTILTLELDRGRLDYFSVYESLVSQYGEPIELDPRSARWEDGATRITLERPLVVKYLDVASFEARVDSGRMEESLDAVARDRFLDEL